MFPLIHPDVVFFLQRPVQDIIIDLVHYAIIQHFAGGETSDDSAVDVHHGWATFGGRDHPACFPESLRKDA